MKNIKKFVVLGSEIVVAERIHDYLLIKHDDTQSPSLGSEFRLINDPNGSEVIYFHQSIIILKYQQVGRSNFKFSSIYKKFNKFC